MDTDTGDIYRSPITGFANRKRYVEGGDILVKVPDTTTWPGYWRSEAATTKKYTMDVFEKGDIYYRTRDALRRNDDGRWFFMDRLGDTFRRKSENVSTAEVAEVIGHFPGVLEANVYGVLVPCHEGRAGCVVVDLDPSKENSFDWKAFAIFGFDKLPKYAVPVCVRVMAGETGGQSSHSHNHKQNKVLLTGEGVDPKLRGSKVKGCELDRFFWLKPKSLGYVPFTDQDWKDLEANQAKL
ncbi:hypothetical protein MMC19_002386 [Ptychographa xylographoides]|nr:hypothetical protein [Ptychographa xylographoides]